MEADDDDAADDDDEEEDSGRRLTAAMGSIVGGCALRAGPEPDGPF